MRKFLYTLSFSLLLIIVLLKCSGNEHMFKALASTYFVGKTGPTVEDLNVFEHRSIKTGKQFPLPHEESHITFEFDTAYINPLENYSPIGFVMLHQDKIIYQNYWNQYSDSSLTNSFSAAKSVVALAVLKAIDMGYIKSVNQKIIDFLPEIDGEYKREVTIKHLLQMTSGIDFDESYGNPLGFMAKAYYGRDLVNKTLSYECDTKPGSEWEYLGGNTILLSIIVARASRQNLSEFVSKEFWQPLGAINEAYWSLDEKDGVEKAYCCFYTNASDFARFGLIVQNNGFYRGHRYISEKLMQDLKKPVVLNNGDTIPHYGYHWWRVEYNGAIANYARGIKGQYIIAIPEYQITMSRMGKKRGETNELNHPVDLYYYLDFAKSIHDQAIVMLGDTVRYISNDSSAVHSTSAEDI